MGKQLAPGVLLTYLHTACTGGCLEVVPLTLPWGRSLPAACLLYTAKGCQPGFSISQGFLSHLGPLGRQAS